MTCKGCKWAEWNEVKRSGVCKYEVQWPAIPYSVMYWKMLIWIADEHDCPVREDA